MWFVKHGHVLEQVCGPALTALAQEGADRKFAAGETIFTPHDGDAGGHVYLLKEGKATVYDLFAGKRFVVDVLCPGDLFGDFRVAASATSLVSNFAAAEKSSVVRVIPRECLLAVLQNAPDLALCLLHILSEKLSVQQARLRDLALMDAERRVVNELRREGTAQPDGSVLTKRETHELLAQRTGLSRETVTKALGRLQEKGIMELDDDRNFIIRHYF